MPDQYRMPAHDCAGITALRWAFGALTARFAFAFLRGSIRLLPAHHPVRLLVLERLDENRDTLNKALTFQLPERVRNLMVTALAAAAGAILFGLLHLQPFTQVSKLTGIGD